MLKLHTPQKKSGKKFPHLSSVALNDNALYMLRQNEDLEEQQLSKHLVQYSPHSPPCPEFIPGEYLKSNYLLHNERVIWFLQVTNALEQISCNLQKTSLLAFDLVKLFL